MKNLLNLLIVILFIISFVSTQATASSSFSTTPPQKIEKKIRIGYLEGGPWLDYPPNFRAILIRLMALGWLEKAEIPAITDTSDTSRLWHWLATEAKSKYLEFPEDAYYSDGWDEDKAKITKLRLLNRLNTTEDIDLMIAMGTLAGKTLATNDHDIPTVVCSATDPLMAGIIKSIADSGYDHVTARIDPTRYRRQVEAFHDVIGFKRLGMAYTDTVIGKSYAALEDVKVVSKLRNFDIIECYTIDDVPDIDLCNKSMIKCAKELAPKIDAFYMTIQNGFNERTLPEILKVMIEYGIPVFTQYDNDMVSHGILMSVDDKSYARAEGFFNADNLARIINGAIPRELNQRNEPPVKITFNKEAARLIDLDDDIYRLLVNVADEVYDTIERPPFPNPATPDKKWRMGYLEGGHSEIYVDNLKYTIKALEKLGWLEISGSLESIKDSRTLWGVLSENVTSKYLCFQKDAYYSNGWNTEKRKKTRKTLLKKLKPGKDIDLMIAMGTWAGIDLANDVHTTPTAVLSTSDPLRAGIVKTLEHSGLNHLVARMDPTRYPRQIETFHDIIGFKKLGVAFSDTIEGRSYCAIDDIRQAALEKGFEVVECFSLSDVPDIHAAEESLLSCVRELVGRIDAFYLTNQGGITPDSLPVILKILHEKGIPTFSQNGIDTVRQGTLMSVSIADKSLLGDFQAELLGKIMNGAQPGTISGVLKMPVKLIFNADTALKIGLDSKTFNLLYESADVIIEEKAHKE